MNIIKSIFDIIYTTDDNIHNIYISKMSLLMRILFVLTNISYVVLLFVTLNKESLNYKELIEFPEYICKSPVLTRLCIFLLCIASTMFHTKQCSCKNKQDLDTCIRLNNVDFVCAGFVGLICVLCYNKLEIIFMIPCIGLMVLGGICKSIGHYNLYLIFHGFWHIFSAIIMFLIIC